MFLLQITHKKEQYDIVVTDAEGTSVLAAFLDLLKSLEDVDIQQVFFKIIPLDE